MLTCSASAGCMYGCLRLASKIAVNTTLAAAAGGLSALLSETLMGAPGDIAPVLNGILAGETSFKAFTLSDFLWALLTALGTVAVHGLGYLG